MSNISSEPKLLQLVFITLIDGEEHEVNLGAPGVFKIPADTVHASILEDVPEPSAGMVQIYDLDDLIWWRYDWKTTGDVLAMRFADSSSEPTDEETAFSKPFDDTLFGKDKCKTLDYEALFQKLSTNLE